MIGKNEIKETDIKILRIIIIFGTWSISRTWKCKNIQRYLKGNLKVFWFTTLDTKQNMQ